MAISRYQIIHKNSLNTEISWQLDIIDTSMPMDQTYSFEADFGSISWGMAGTPNDLLPGIYPTTLRAGMLIEDTIVEGILSRLRESDERRFVCKYYREGILEFVGYILPDQCSYDDLYYPYPLSLQAVAGFHILETIDYKRWYGKFEYMTCENIVLNDNSGYSETPISSCLVGAEWVLQVHETWIIPNDPYSGEPGAYVQSGAKTTWTREIVSALDEPPGSGWVAEGVNTWVRGPAYTTEEILTDTDYYRLTRIWTNEPYEILNDIFQKAVDYIGLGDYQEETAYDVLMTLHNAQMKDAVNDPSLYIQVPVQKYIDEPITMLQLLTKLCEHFGMRIYMSGGIFKFECIKDRANPSLIRFGYDKNGDATTNITTNDTLAIPDSHVATGGRWSFQAASREVNVKLKLDESNYLKQTYWQTGIEGERYLGVINNTAEVSGIYFKFKLRSISWFNPDILDNYPATLWPALTTHVVRWFIRIRLVNRVTGATFWFKPSPSYYFWLPINSSAPNWGTWETGAGIHQVEQRVEGVDIHADSNGNPIENPIVYTRNINWKKSLPGSNGDSFDIYVGFTTDYSFPPNSNGQQGLNHVWPDEFPNDYSIFGQSFENELYLIDDDGNKLSGDIERIYTIRNSLNNSKIHNINADFGDLLYHKQGLRVLNGVDKWVPTYEEWTHGGIGTEKAFLALLGEDMMSLRMTPRNIFNGAFYNTQFSLHWLLQRASYKYLPLRITADTAMDHYDGEFIEIASTTPPDGTPIDNPPEDISLEGFELGGDPDPGPTEPALYFETNEVITASTTIDEVDIVNTLGIAYPAGEMLLIVDPVTGDQQIITLTQDINPGDTVMYFESTFFNHTFPDASWIVLAITDEDGIGFNGIAYTFGHPSYSASSHSVPGYYNLPDPETTSAHIIENSISIWKNGVKMFFRAVASSPPDPHEYQIDDAANELLFPFPFMGDRIYINAR